MDVSDALRTLAYWVRHGPRPEDSLGATAIARLVHWRLWASLALQFIPVILGFAVLSYLDSPVFAILVTWVGMVLTSEHAFKLSPKYNLTLNY